MYADVLVSRLRDGALLPDRQHPSDAGWDLHAVEPATVAPFARALIPTGIAIALPPGFAAFVVPRSGLAIKQGITLTNSPGTIDAGYRGEIKVIVANSDPNESVEIAAGQRIAQLIVQRVAEVTWHEVATLPGADRGLSGFGSTGS